MCVSYGIIEGLTQISRILRILNYFLFTFPLARQHIGEMGVLHIRSRNQKSDYSSIYIIFVPLPPPIHVISMTIYQFSHPFENTN